MEQYERYFKAREKKSKKIKGCIGFSVDRNIDLEIKIGKS